MKKLILATLLLVGISSFAQVEVGIMFAPNISTNRVSDDANLFTVLKNGAGVRYSVGPTIDIFLKDNIAFSTGAFLSVRRAGLDFKYDSTGSTSLTPVINLQYIQIPFAIKMYTNDIAERMKLYFTLGGNLDTKIAENFKEQASKDFFKNEFAKLIDAGINIGIGFELGIGSSNKVFGGITYNRGLVNVIRSNFYEQINSDNIKLNNDTFSLVMGFKF